MNGNRARPVFRLSDLTVRENPAGESRRSSDLKDEKNFRSLKIQRINDPGLRSAYMVYPLKKPGGLK
jgi:hypothetical protein